VTNRGLYLMIILCQTISVAIRGLYLKKTVRLIPSDQQRSVPDGSSMSENLRSQQGLTPSKGVYLLNAMLPSKSVYLPSAMSPSKGVYLLN
jgi:hypothetical protein